MPAGNQTSLTWLSAYKPNLSVNKHWSVAFLTATFCLWKAYLGHSFDRPNAAWLPEAVLVMYISMLRKRIISDRSASLSKIFSDKDYNPSSFLIVWGKEPQTIRVLKGPKIFWGNGERLDSMLGSNSWVTISDSD